MNTEGIISIGDIVKMKYIMFWQLKNQPGKYTESTALVIEKEANWVRVIFEQGEVRRDLTEHWDVVDGSR